MISEEYREYNKKLHEQPEYGHDGGRWAELLIKTCKEAEFFSVLDYGCGKGQLKREIMKRTTALKVSEYDPAIEGKDQKPKPVDLVFCGDVLEHIEPEYLDDVLGDIARCSGKGAVLYIATNPARKTLPDGRNAHLIQENMHWWFNKVSEHMEVSSTEVYKLARILMTCVPLGRNMT